MKPADKTLFFLLHALNPREKAHLLALARAGSAYQELLSDLLAQTEFDENALLQSKKKYAKGLPEQKQYLLEWTAAQLARRNAHLPEEEMHTKLQICRELHRRGQSSAAQIRLHSLVKRLMASFEFETALLGLQHLRAFAAPNDTPLLHWVNEQNQIVLAQLVEREQLLALRSQTVLAQRKFQQSPDATAQHTILEILADPLLMREPPQNFPNALLFWQTKSIAHYTLSQRGAALAANEKLLQLFDLYPVQIEIFPDRYLAIWQNYLIDLFQLQRQEAFELGLNQLEKISLQPVFGKQPLLAARIFRQTRQLRLNGLLQQSKFKEAKIHLPDLQQGIETHYKNLNRAEILSLHYLNAYIFWGNGQWSASIGALQPILQEPKDDIVFEVFNYARILALVSHYELGHHQLLESLLPATRRYWQKRGQLSEIHSLLLVYLNKSGKSALAKNNFSQQLSVIAEAPAHSRLFQYVDLQRWMLGQCQ